MAGGQERELRRRIRSVQSTKKITRAMELIAASRILKAQQAIEAARPYVAQIREVIRRVAASPDARGHDLFREVDEVRNVAVVSIAGDRGLSGAFNSSILRTTERHIRQEEREGRNVRLITVGRKTQSYFRYRGHEIANAFTGMSDRPDFADARRIVGAVMPAFAEGEVDRVEIIHTRFISLGSQEVVVRRLIPLEDLQEEEQEEDRPAGAPPGFHVDYLFEPEPAEILDRLLPSWLEAEVLAALLDSAASQHAAQQRAMAAATDNADDLITSYTREMNRARQDAITTEIMEIVGGAEALRQARPDGHGTTSRLETFDTGAGTPA